MTDPRRPRDPARTSPFASLLPTPATIAAAKAGKLKAPAKRAAAPTTKPAGKGSAKPAAVAARSSLTTAAKRSTFAHLLPTAAQVEAREAEERRVARAARSTPAKATEPTFAEKVEAAGRKLRGEAGHVRRQARRPE